MKLVILGATGGCGKHICRLALENGHSITVIVRNELKLDEDVRSRQDVKIVQMETLHVDQLSEAMDGADAVISALGYFGIKILPFTKVTFHQDMIRIIVAAMRRQDIRRLIVITSWYTSEWLPDRSAVRKFFERPLYMDRHMLDFAKMEQFLADESENVDFTCVRLPTLTDEEKTDKVIKTAVDKQMVEDFDKSNGPNMARADVGRFVIQCLEESSFVGHCVAISY